MSFPTLFQGLTLFFHQDIDIAYKSLEALVTRLYQTSRRQERQALKDYMKELTDGRYDETQLREIWLKSRAEVCLFGEMRGTVQSV